MRVEDIGRLRSVTSRAHVSCVSLTARTGTGKTLLARAIASNIEANFLKVRGAARLCLAGLGNA
jgi:SpoVK/Ycf46/Vps4 family AAA+-type ATPase